MHYNPSTPADAEVMRDIAGNRVAEAVAGIERWQQLSAHQRAWATAAQASREMAAARVAEAVANIERWQRIRDLRQAEYAQAVNALEWWTFPMYDGTSDASTTPR
jgi:(p)ppGpp synthase/HD superfamily hydrolase